MVDIRAERQSRLSNLHPVFREVDRAVHAYVEVLRAEPSLEDQQIQRELLASGVEPSVAVGCVTFVPLAFGRTIVRDLGVEPADSYVEHDPANSTEREKPLGEQLEYIWSKSVADLYARSDEYGEAFGTIATRSAEVDAINNALHSGCDPESLRGAALDPPIVFVTTRGSDTG